MSGANVSTTYVIALNAALFALCAALPALVISFLRQTIIARRLPSGFALSKLEAMEFDRAILMYHKVINGLREIDQRGHDAAASLWARYRLRGGVKRQCGRERMDLQAYGRHLRAAIFRLQGLPIKRFKNVAHVVGARFALGCSLAVYAIVMMILMAILYLEDIRWAEEIWRDLGALLLWRPVDERLLYANFTSAIFGLVAAPLFYLTHRARLHSLHRREIRDLKEFAAADPERLIADRQHNRAEQAAAAEETDLGSAEQKRDQESNERAEYDAGQESSERPSPFEAPPDDPWHVVLGVSPWATAEEIRQAYRTLIKRSHPDRVHGMSSIFRDLAEAETKRLNAAYEDALMSLREVEYEFSGASPSYTRH